MAASVGIVGASGYGGAELLRLLAGHPAIEVAVVAANSRADQPVASLFPNLAGEARFTGVDVGELAALDLVFLATPHGASLDLGPRLADAGVKVVDLSGAFRLSADAFATWYGEPHPHPDRTPAAYGLTEFNRDAIRDASLVANPGCYVATTLLGLVPVAPLVDLDTLVVDGKSGTSGAGRAAKDHLTFSSVHGDLVAYGAPTHRHTAEIEAGLALLAGVPRPTVSFTPHLVPMSRGLLATSVVTLKDGVSQADVDAAYREAYAGEAFVHMLPTGTFPHTKAVAGSNGCQVSAVVDGRTGRLVVTSVTDNLGKGAAGSALQNANLMLGLDEALGLSAIGVYP